MTVQELIDELQDRDPTMQVSVTIETEDGELIDAALTSAYVSVGRVFLAGEDGQ